MFREMVSNNYEGLKGFLYDYLDGELDKEDILSELGMNQ